MVANPEQQPSGGSIEGEFAAETDKLRSEAIERIMDKGFPQAGDPDEGDPHGAVYQPDLYKQTWDQVDSYVAAVQTNETLNKTLHTYLQDAEHARALREVIDQLKAGTAPNDLLAAEENGPPNLRNLTAMLAFENVAKGAIRSEGGKLSPDKQRQWIDLTGPEGETARRLIRVAEIMDAESNAVMIKHEIHPEDMKVTGEEYAADFEKFSKRTDIPQEYRNRAREMASNLRIDAMKQEKPVARPPEKKAPKVESREPVRGVEVKLEYDPSHKLFGKDNPLKAEDMRQMQGRLEELTREGTTKNALEVAKIAAHLKRAGVRLEEGHGEIGSYLQRQREKMQKEGPRALAQYLTYGKYAGFVNEITDQENQWLMGAIQDRIKNDPTHKGLARLSMNARYLGVRGYSAELVRASVVEEINVLKQSGNVEGAAKEAARARQAGIDPTEVFTNDGFTEKLQRQLVEHTTSGRWENFARLRNNLDSAWRHLPVLDKQVTGLMDHFETAREQAKKDGQWDTYAEYAANVWDLSSREGKRQRRESVAPKTAEVRERTVRERSTLTDQEFEEYLGGPEPVRQPETPVEETPDFQEVPAEPMVTGNWITRFWGRLFRLGERRTSDQETPTNTAA